jgi:hypothetical protein
MNRQNIFWHTNEGQSNFTKGFFHSSANPQFMVPMRVVWMSRLFRNRGATVLKASRSNSAMPKRVEDLNALGWSSCRGWSATQPRSVQGVQPRELRFVSQTCMIACNAIGLKNG